MGLRKRLLDECDGLCGNVGVFLLRVGECLLESGRFALLQGFVGLLTCPFTFGRFGWGRLTSCLINIGIVSAGGLQLTTSPDLELRRSGTCLHGWLNTLILATAESLRGNCFHAVKFACPSMIYIQLLGKLYLQVTPSYMDVSGIKSLLDTMVRDCQTKGDQIVGCCSLSDR